MACGLTGLHVYASTLSGLRPRRFVTRPVAELIPEDDFPITRDHIGVPESTLWPHRAHEFEPAVQLFTEFSRPSIVSTSELADKAEIAEERHTLFSS